MDDDDKDQSRPSLPAMPDITPSNMRPDPDPIIFSDLPVPADQAEDPWGGAVTL